MTSTAKAQAAGRYRLNITTPDGLSSRRFSNRQDADSAFIAAKRRIHIGTIELHDTDTIGGLLRSHRTTIKEFERAAAEARNG